MSVGRRSVDGADGFQRSVATVLNGQRQTVLLGRADRTTGRTRVSVFVAVIVDVVVRRVALAVTAVAEVVAGTRTFQTLEQIGTDGRAVAVLVCHHVLFHVALYMTMVTKFINQKLIYVNLINRKFE